MKFAFGFLVGLMTGVTIVLAPLIAIFVAMAGFGNEDETKNESVVNDVPPKDLSGSDPEKVHHRGAS